MSAPAPASTDGTGPAAEPEPRLRRSAVPLREPLAAASVRPRPEPVTGAVQGTLALALPWEAPPVVRVLHRVPTPDEPDPTARPGSAPAPVPPDARDWAVTFVHAALEVATGLRPAGQLVRWTTPEVHVSLARRGALAARARRFAAAATPQVRLRTLLVGAPVPGVREVAAVMSGPDRIRAVAFRMDAFQCRWRVTALEFG